MSKSYRPSNGSEGLYFTAEFCERCTKYADGGCPILLNTLLYEKNEPEYPGEWVYDDSGNPTCTAFEQAG